VIVKAKKKLSRRDAYEWFVVNDSGGLLEPDKWPDWDEWRHAVGNKAKYVEVLDLVGQLRKLPPPEPVGRQALVEDAALDPPVLEAVEDVGKDPSGSSRRH
jgi:hypothetical protein